MFRKTLVAFLGFSLLVLLLIVGYAATGLAGPGAAVEEARRALAEGRPFEAIRVLDLAEKSIGPTGSPGLRRDILEQRARAYLAAGSDRRALIDLAQLVDVYDPENTDLQRMHIRALITTDNADEAQRRALELLRQDPDNGRLLELAGEACQKRYQERLADLVEELSSKLPPASVQEAVAALRPYLYRDDSDPRAALGFERFGEILAEFRHEAWVSGVCTPALREIKRLVQEAEDFYRRSLASGGTPVAAYRGLAFALREGGRIDDLVALSEVYLRRFRHAFTTYAAVQVAEAHLDAGRLRAVLELASRFVPEEGWRQRLEQGSYDDAVRHVLLAKARALHALDDRPGLDRLVAQVQEMAATGLLELEPEATFVEALQRELRGEHQRIDPLLAPFSWQREFRLPPKSGEDYFVTAMRMRLDAAEAHGASPDHYRDLCKTWIEHRPDDPEPYRRRAELLLELGKSEDAVIDARIHFELVGHDSDEALRLYAAAADRAHESSGRDSAALLRQCLELRRTLPTDVATDVLYLRLAQRALEEKHYRVAMAASERASQRFPWARWPRYVWAEAALGAGEPLEAVHAMETLRKHYPEDARGLALLRRARTAAGRDVDELLYPMAMHGGPDHGVAAALLAHCFERRDLAQAQRFAARIGRVFGQDPDVLLLVVDTLLIANRKEQARQLLVPALQLLTRQGAPEARPAMQRFVRLRAAEGPSSAMSSLARVARDMHLDAPDALLGMAEAMYDHGHHEAARLLLAPVFEDPANADARSGEHYLLAGRVALQLGLYEEAEERLTQALTFDDGLRAQRPLALLLLRDEREAEAAEAFWETAAVDQAGAALAIRLDRPSVAAPWLQEKLARNPMDVPALCMAALVRPGPVSEDIASLVDETRDLLLEVLVYGEVDGFEEHALELATELHERLPDSAAATWLYAHQLDRAGHAQAALHELRQLGERGYAAAYDEIVRILQQRDPQQLENPDILARIAAIVQRTGDHAPPRLRAVAMRTLTSTLSEGATLAADKVELLATLWTRFPEQTQAGLREVGLLARHGRADDALILLDHIESNVSAHERGLFAAVFADVARAITATDGDPQVRAGLLRRARRLMQVDGALGPLVHFVLDHRPGPAADADARQDEAARQRLAEEHALLEEHFELFRRGEDPNTDTIVRTLLRLEPIEGAETVLARVESLLRNDPSLVPVWLLRARMLEARGRPEEALAGLRWLFRYLEDGNLALEYARIAGQAGLTEPEDEDRLLRLDADLARTPQAALARGLLALRMARYAEAAELLAGATRRPDGAHLYYRALALLPLPGPDAMREAAELLGRFERAHPTSHLSTIAPNLRQQLEHTTGRAQPVAAGERR